MSTAFNSFIPQFACHKIFASKDKALIRFTVRMVLEEGFL